MFRNYFLIAIRNLKRHITFSFINISGLAIGLTCCMLILLFTKDEISYDRFHKNREQIYQLVCDRIERDGLATKSALAAQVQGPAFKQAIPEIQAFTRVDHKPIVLKKDNETFTEDICWVDDNFFSILSFPLIAGNATQVLAGLNSTVLTAETAERLFNSTNVVGKTINLEINGQFEPFTITGIAKAAPQNSSIKFTILAPFKYLERSNPDNGWMWFSFPTFFLLQPGTNPATVEAKMKQTYQLQAKSEIDMNHEAGYDTQFNWGLISFTDMHLYTDYQGMPEASDPLYVYILNGITLFILLIACINFVNLSIAQSLQRKKEIGIRKVAGARQDQLHFQFLGESMIICLIAFIFAFLFTLLLLPFFNELAGKKLSLSYLFDLPLVTGFCLLYIFTVLAAGLYPAKVIAGFNVVAALYNKSTYSGKSYLTKGLVVLQFSIATLLIITTLFIYAQFNYLTTTDLGFNDKNLVEFIVDKAIMDKPMMDATKVVFTSVPGVEAVAYRNVGKFGGKTRAGGKEFMATYEHIDENYLPLLQTQVLAGRNFSAEFPYDSSNSVLVNESFARQAGWKDPVGKSVDLMNLPGWGTRKITVIGVVKDYHFESLKEKIKPELFTMEPQLPLGRMLVRIKPGNIPATIHAMEATYHRLFPDHPFRYAFTEELLHKNYAAERQWKQIISFAAIVAIFISCIGLFGLAMLSASMRSKEIGIRKVLGATTAQVIQMIATDFISLVFIAFVVAVPLGWWIINRWLQQFAYRIDLSWWVFALAGLFILLIALLTVGFHTIKSSLAKPAHTLKTQ